MTDYQRTGRGMRSVKASPRILEYPNTPLVPPRHKFSDTLSAFDILAIEARKAKRQEIILSGEFVSSIIWED